MPQVVKDQIPFSHYLHMQFSSPSIHPPDPGNQQGPSIAAKIINLFTCSYNLDCPLGAVRALADLAGFKAWAIIR